MVRSPVDYGCYSKSYPEGVAYLILSTDDFLSMLPLIVLLQSHHLHQQGSSLSQYENYYWP